MNIVRRFDVAHDLNLPSHERTAQKEVAELGQTVRFDESFQFQDGGGGDVERQRNTHRCWNDQRVANDGQSLEGVDVDTFLEFVDQLWTGAYGFSNTTTSSSSSSSSPSSSSSTVAAAL